jgi:hypothetical protein
MGEMVVAARACGTVAVGAVIWVLSGCGGGAGSHPASSHRSSAATTAATNPSPPVSAASATPVVDLPGLGSLSYRCDTTGRRVLASLGGNVLATEQVTVERDGGEHLLRTTINPPSQVTVPLAPYRSLIWRIIQSTEANTVEATVRLDFHTGAPGRQASIDCTLSRWTSTVNIVEHTGRWSLPPAWP